MFPRKDIALISVARRHIYIRVYRRCQALGHDSVRAGIEHYIEKGESPNTFAPKLDLDPTTVYRWIKILKISYTRKKMGEGLREFYKNHK